MKKFTPQRKYGNQAVHRQFLARLAQVLPVGCMPIIITDAGFRSTWFDLVTERHWQSVGRIRGKDIVSIAAGPWKRCPEVCQEATSRVQAFADARYVRSHPTAYRLSAGAGQARSQRAAPSHANGQAFPFPCIDQGGS